MGDLAIQPGVGAGNKLFIKTQDGTSVLETSDSGASLGNSTQDNITRVGTVTTGTLQSGVTFPTGHIIQVVRKSVHSYVDSSGTTNAWENDTNDLHITVTAGNLVIATVCGGMFNAGNAVTGFWRFIRFSENGGTANQDIWTSTAIGYNAAVYHYASTQTASCIAAHTGEMLVKRGSDNSGSTGNTAWASDVNNYGPVHYHVMEIQQ